MAGKVIDLLLNHTVATGATMAVRADMRGSVIPIPREWVHDEWIAIIAASMNRLGFLDQCLIDYRQHRAQQIGGLRKGIITKITTASRDNAESMCRREIWRYQLLLERCDLLDIENRHFVSDKVIDKINHLLARKRISTESLYLRIYIMLVELVTRRYSKYGCGVSSALKDLFLSLKAKP